jgi:murein DD-endopeptidase MepM/ murein hydrolase activator NlpD
MGQRSRYLAVGGVCAALLFSAADANAGRKKRHRTQSMELGESLVRLMRVVDPMGMFSRLELETYRILQVAPVKAPKSSPFGMRFHPILKRRKVHKGLDFRADLGTPVAAAAPGKVVFAGSKGTYGRIVIIDHGLGLETRYAHLHRVKVSPGEFVAAGARIGLVGATGRVTGAHLHFEVRIRDRAIDPELCYSDADN